MTTESTSTYPSTIVTSEATFNVLSLLEMYQILALALSSQNLALSRKYGEIGLQPNF